MFVKIVVYMSGIGHFWVKTSQCEQRKFDPWVWQNINFVSVWQFPFLLLSIIGVTELLLKSFYISLAVKSFYRTESYIRACLFGPVGQCRTDEFLVSLCSIQFRIMAKTILKILYARHHKPLLITNCSWVLSIHK